MFFVRNLFVGVFTFFAIATIAYAATTLSTNIATDGTLSVTGATTLSGGATLTCTGCITDTNIASALTGKTYNGNTITTGTGTLTLGAGKTLTANNSLILAGTDGTTITFQGTDTYVGRATTDTLTNKTLTSPTLTTPALGVATGTSLTASSFLTGTVLTASSTTNQLVLGTAPSTITITSPAPASARTYTLPDNATASTNFVLAPTSTTATQALFATATAGAPAFRAIALTDLPAQTGTGSIVLATSPTLVTPALGAATATSLAIGGGTAITKMSVYAPSLTPVATSAAIQTTEQTFTVTGLTTADKVFVNGPAPTSLCPPVTFRVSAANTLAIGFSTLTAAACTPVAGTYNIVAVTN